MMIEVPKTKTQIEVELKNFVLKLSGEHNIRYSFVSDSKSISECIDELSWKLTRIKQYVQGEFTAEELNEFDKLEKAMNKKIKKVMGKKIKRRSKLRER